MRLGDPPTHVQSHFAEQRLGYHHVYAVNASEVHTCDALQFAAQIEAWSILGGWLLCLELLRRGLDRKGMCQAGEVLLQSLVTLGDSFLIGVVHVYFLMQHEQQFRTPVALQAFGDFFVAGVNPRIAEHSQLQWIALAATIARMIACPVSPLMSLITFANCTFICVRAFCIRWMQVAAPRTCSPRCRQ